MSRVRSLPVSDTTGTQEVEDISAAALIKWVVGLVQVSQVADAIVRHHFPGGLSHHHQIGVEAEQAKHDDPGQDQNNEINEEYNIHLEPLLPFPLVHNGIPGNNTTIKNT